MTKLLVLVVLCTIAASASAAVKVLTGDHLTTAYDHRPDQSNETIGSLTHEIMTEAKDVGHHVFGTVKNVTYQAANGLNRKVRSAIAEGNPSLLHTAHEMASNFSKLNFTEAGQKISRVVRSLWSNEVADGSKSIIAQLTEINNGELKTRSGVNSPNSQDFNDTARYNDVQSGYESNYQSTPYYQSTTTTPRTIVIKGPQGPAGIPGLPGLPGLPGPAADIGPLRISVLAKLAKLSSLVKKVVILICLKSAGLLALILALVIPIYAKFKKAGIVLPIGFAGAAAPTDYAPVGQSGYYNSPEHVYNGIDQAAKKYGG